jgi:hypothetical protein
VGERASLKSAKDPRFAPKARETKKVPKLIEKTFLIFLEQFF